MSKTSNFFGTCAVVIDLLEWCGEKWNLNQPRGFEWGFICKFGEGVDKIWGVGISYILKVHELFYVMTL